MRSCGLMLCAYHSPGGIVPQSDLSRNPRDSWYRLRYYNHLWRDV